MQQASRHDVRAASKNVGHAGGWIMGIRNLDAVVVVGVGPSSRCLAGEASKPCAIDSDEVFISD